MPGLMNQNKMTKRIKNIEPEKNFFVIFICGHSLPRMKYILFACLNRNKSTQTPGLIKNQDGGNPDIKPAGQ